MTTVSNTTDPSLKTTCHCGRVTLQLPSKPQQLNECHCTVCYKYGALWGYFKRSDVGITLNDGAVLEKYIRSDEGCQGRLSFNRCSKCGCVMAWFGEKDLATPDSKMGVNCRMSPYEVVEAIPREVSIC
ncbi:glutathione-dependent formaldehyde-activating GFA [Chaetomium sp. MPI-CAGE-AT-0009]|nr:glutathione-dependent formaldehyde-activating GFA [Chaetomium sp. MPI-CAGE-AT-0009]